MTLGGGTFTDYNKPFAGAYVNTVTVSRNTSLYGERGYVAAPMALSWGNNEEIITLNKSDFYETAWTKLGYQFYDAEMLYIREMLKFAKSVQVARLNRGGEKAENGIFIANCAGTRGNDLITVVTLHENATEEEPVYNVDTYLGTTLVDRQQNVRSIADLAKNDFATPKTDATLYVTAGIAFTGGTDGAITVEGHQIALGKLENCYFNTLVCASADENVKSLYFEFTKRLNENVGMKFQTVAHRFANSDSELLISVENNVNPDLVYWVGGACAGIAINESLTNKPYNGELNVVCDDYRISDYENFVEQGKFAFYLDAGKPTVLSDINTLTSFTNEKNEWFKENQTVRIASQSSMDKARIFNTLFLGKVPNDEAGRLSLWNQLTTYNSEFLQNKWRAIDFYDTADTQVYYIDKKKVGVTEQLNLVNAMEQVYITTVFI